MSATQIFAAWGELSIYTNAESCPMCASAIRWAGFKEYSTFFYLWPLLIFLPFSHCLFVFFDCPYPSISKSKALTYEFH